MKRLFEVFADPLQNYGFDMTKDRVEVVVVLESLIWFALVHGFFVFDFATRREPWSQ
jgi:hypothetical protein